MAEGKEILLIGVGLPRTGTFSTKAALETILPGKCYHMHEALSGKDHKDFWIRMFNNTIDDDEIREFFLSRGYIACVDAPSAFFYKRFMKIFPNAKFLLNTRDRSSWARSVKATICDAERFTAKVITLNKWLGLFGKLLLPDTTFYSELRNANIRYGEMVQACDNDVGEEFFNSWNSMIINEIPSDKLLVFDVKHGWQPLCPFLDVPVPTTEFPRSNDKKEFTERFQLTKKSIKKRLTILISIVVTAASVAIYYKCYM